jgi:hypothetical protein
MKQAHYSLFLELFIFYFWNKAMLSNESEFQSINFHLDI